ncbi:type I-E CRISPR-associated protein Cse2/CasB [Streptomyces sp. OUCMDZ-4982]|uniref:type I-E CRISPR-associated protein Cse2/CasB n=1 Tax=Streptomyces sp. OUCMDZ-4982 TaxID=2973090 RepID=UPI00215D49E9|nr:type I-E CRISPR-associated protein Cse2/CasB [Streptomyces sp. OUCMDZ-4982]MCR8945130.1 type I-E CRISPR-associated protein Cse2/CasB [Streptomyces sp. OUCMDZ-4982]
MRTPVLHATFPPPPPASREIAAANLTRWLSRLHHHGQWQTLALLREGAPAAPSLASWDLPAPGADRPSGFPSRPFIWEDIGKPVPVELGPGIRFTYPEWFIYRESVNEVFGGRDAEAFRAVAHLFAVYHRRAPSRHSPAGSDHFPAADARRPPARGIRDRTGTSPGKALRVLQNECGHLVRPAALEPGTAGRLLNALVRQRRQLPLPELRRVCVTLREHKMRPPSWRRLALDLGDWEKRLPRDGRGGPRTVAEQWVWEFHDLGFVD